MGGVVGKVGLVSLGAAAIGAAAVDHGQKVAREAAEAVFEAITEAADAASRYVSAMYRAVSSATADAYEEAKRVVAQACDAVKRAAARVTSRLFVLIDHVHGVMAASFAKTELDAVSGLVGASDVASLVAAIVAGIKRLSWHIFPEQPFGRYAPSNLPKGRRAASSAAEMMEILGLFPSAVGEMLGLKVLRAGKIAISVISVAAQLVFALLLA